jgi:hypothetical protein
MQYPWRKWSIAAKPSPLLDGVDTVSLLQENKPIQNEYLRMQLSKA